MADTFAARVAQAVSDPGSITAQEIDEFTQVAETYISWQTRAVLSVFSEARWAPDAAPAGGGGSGTAVLLAIYCAVVFVAGVWLGAVWL